MQSIEATNFQNMQLNDLKPNAIRKKSEAVGRVSAERPRTRQRDTETRAGPESAPAERDL